VSKKFNLDNVENPAARFISGAKPIPFEVNDTPKEELRVKESADLEDMPSGKVSHEVKKPGRPRIETREVKSKRLNVLILPSIVEQLKKVSAMKRTSVNALINTFLKDRLERESDTIKRYDDVFGDHE
jgi:predicted HicB family RNase H-like nuclease